MKKGLAFEYLYLPGFTQYQTVPAGKESAALANIHFGDWVLANFKSVDEVRAALKNIYVFGEAIAAVDNQILPLHASIHDASGKSIIVEFVNGNVQVYDSIGVLTNSPTYDWQLVNLRNYLNITPINPNPITAHGITYAALGQGAGLHGLPGDPLPPSRFVKMSIMLKTLLPVKNSKEALNYAQHVINNVDIPFGFVREVNSGDVTNEYTQWTVFKDLTHKVLYYKTYNDTTLHSVDLTKMDFSPTATAAKMPIASEQYIIDETQGFADHKS